MKTLSLSYKISACMKGTTLPILVRVLTSIDYWKAWFLTLCSSLHTRTSTRNKQQKFAQEKLLRKPHPFGLSVSHNLKEVKIDQKNSVKRMPYMTQSRCTMICLLIRENSCKAFALEVSNVYGFCRQNLPRQHNSIWPTLFALKKE